MARHVMDIRGYKIAVEAKSASQVAWLRNLYMNRSDAWLAFCERETADDATPLQAPPTLTVVT